MRVVIECACEKCDGCYCFAEIEISKAGMFKIPDRCIFDGKEADWRVLRIKVEGE